MLRDVFDITDTEDATEIISLDASDQYVVEDAALLFGGTFERAGHDLVIRKEGADTVRIEDYFISMPPADLLAENGAVLRGDLVELLAGPLAPGQYAQAGNATGASPIGQVETLDGGASVQRTDGTVETLQVGMKVFERDVLQTDEGATLSVTFVDGTIFTLASASRMVIDELVYDPSADDNSGGFSLIQGSFVFIAGQVAKTGGMDVSTPSSTMGIRGTTVVVELSSQNGIEVTEVTLTQDPDGDVGRILWKDNADQVIADIQETDVKWTYSTIDGVAREVPRNAQDILEDSVLIAEAFAAFQAATLRVDAGQTFVTLDDPISVQQSNDPVLDGGQDLDVDSVDDLDTIDPGEQIENAPQTDTTQPFDDGNLIQSAPPTLQTVSVQGQEDSPSAISGVLDLSGIEGSIQSISISQGPSNGQASISANGAFSFVPQANFNGVDSFSFVISSGGGQVTEGTVEVNVLPVNDAPSASDIANFIVEDSVVSGPVPVSDVDGDTLVFSIAAAPASGTLVVVQNGTYAYAPNPDFFGADSFSIQATDPAGESAVSNISVFVQAQADPPSVIADPAQSTAAVTEDAVLSTVSGVLSANDADPGDTLTWSGSTTGQFGQFSINAAGAWTYTLDQTLADALAQGEVAQDVFVATVSDASGLTNTASVAITVTGSNDAPIVSSNTFFQSIVGDTVAGALSAVDLDGGTGSTITFVLGADGPANGTVVIAADGTFEYTPDPGFAGADGFEYIVTDADGGQSTARARLAVQSDPAVPLNQSVSIGVSSEATAQTAAGAIEIDIDPIPAPALNLAFALDRSGSIGSEAWANVVEAVREAIVALSSQFAGTTTTVDVQLITFATDVQTSAIYDLQDPALLTAVDSLFADYNGGFTAWDLAFQAAGDFFFSEPSLEPNFLLFVTDGDPTGNDWLAPLAALKDPADAFDVTISAFGFGPEFSEGSLDFVDAGAVRLDDASLLSDAFQTTPIFNPELISFEVSLETESNAQVVIANESTTGLLSEGADFELPLSSIANIAELLGETNLISITAMFDLNNDPNSSELQIYSTEIIGKTATAQTEVGLSGADLLFGSDAGDNLQGAAGNDVLLGYGGDDTIDGGLGADTIKAGAGNDLIRVSDMPDLGDIIDGGDGRDTLQFDAVGEINAMIATLDLSSIEVLDIENGQDDILQLDFDTIAALSEDSDTDLETLLNEALPNTHTIEGDASDKVVLDGAGVYTVAQTDTVTDANGGAIEVWSFSVAGGNALATLGVAGDADVSTVNAVA